MTTRRARRLAAAAAPAALAACQGRQSVLDPAGPQALHLFNLGTFLWITAGIVFVLVMAALAVALAQARRRDVPDLSEAGEGRARRIVAGATGVTLAILLVFLVVSYLTGRAYAVTPEGGRPLQVTVVGHQWWWEVQYSDSVNSRSLTTANEIHVPVGRTVILKMTSHDVIHSFWVPNLAGKKDLVPGYSTTTWLRADRPGIYRGQCAEFCGYQHALMGLLVVAHTPEEFEGWLRSQRKPAADPGDPRAQRGQQLFQSLSCALCHTVQGTQAGGKRAPDLTHLASRRTLAAGTLPNTSAQLSAWIADPQKFKPGTNMPATPMSAQDLQAIVAYLETLK